MKRFLVSLIGRANLGYKGCKLRDHEICCAYVHGKSKAEAISKFWEQLEKNPLISEHYSRRDFKITAERWESDELNRYGEPLGDWESSLPFDQLACAVWNDEKYELESAEIKEGSRVMIKRLSQIDDQSWLVDEMERFCGMWASVKYDYENDFVELTGIDGLEGWQWKKDALIPQSEDSFKAHELAEKISQMDSAVVAKAVDESLEKIKMEKAKAELQSNLSAHLKALDDERKERKAQAEAEAIQKGAIINPEKKYHVISWRIGAPIDEKTDCGIWDGSGMAHFSEGFGGFAYSADGWLYFAQEAEDEITAEPDQAKAQRTNSWNVSVFFSKNQIVDELQKLKDDLGSGDVVGCTKIHEHQRNRFIKALDVALFLINATDELPESSQESSSDNSKEIIKETAEESTESNLEAQDASSAVEFKKISDYEIKASWNGETIGRISITFHYKSYSPVIKIYRISGNMREKFETLDDAKMHLIQNFRAQAQEALDQAEDEKIKLKIRNKLDVLDDQIADLFIKGAEMRTGKEAE